MSSNPCESASAETTALPATSSPASIPDSVTIPAASSAQSLPDTACLTVTPAACYRGALALGSRPAFIWYNEYERIELSGKVVANHLAKVMNFLSDECEIGGDSAVTLATVPYWRSVLWAIAALSCGSPLRIVPPVTNEVSGQLQEDFPLCIFPDGTSPSAQLPSSVYILSDLARADLYTDAPIVALDSRHPFALQWPDELPRGIWDGIADVYGYADVPLIEPSSVPLSVTIPLALAQHAEQVGSGASSWRPEPRRYAMSTGCLTESICLTLAGLASASTIIILDPSRNIADICHAEQAIALNYRPA
ncbi:TIGR03089 family protein [Trueperella sp. LYQ141]|uniref:TIGR03089 family protein n=1 Tax=Trueperella sp. LYQ141 TaxID=3391058 RepID=UPI0039838DD7